jgi:hypothetical protein
MRLDPSGKHGRTSIDLQHPSIQEGAVLHVVVAHAALLDLPDSLIQQHLLPLLASADKKMLRCGLLQSHNAMLM